jgi:hypothetical protein
LLKYVPGQDLKYTSSLTAGASFVTKKQTQSFKATITTVTHSLVKSVDTTGNGTIGSKVDSVKISANVNGKDVPVPVTNKDIQSASSNMTTTMSPRGAFMGFDAGQSMKGTDPQQIKMMSAMITSLMSDLAPLPDHPVNIGDSWRGGLTFKPAGLVVSMKMTLNGIKQVGNDSVAQIGTKIFVTFDPPADAKMKSGVKAPAGSIEVSGTGEFDLDTTGGYFNSSEMDLTATAKAKGNVQTPKMTILSGQSASFNCHIESVLDSVTVNAPATDSTPAPAVQ